MSIELLMWSCESTLKMMENAWLYNKLLTAYLVPRVVNKLLKSSFSGYFQEHRGKTSAHASTLPVIVNSNLMRICSERFRRLKMAVKRSDFIVRLYSQISSAKINMSF